MKKICSLGLLCLSLSGFAGVTGTPDQDPVVAYAQSIFSDGDKPSAGFLINNTFDCVAMSAERDSFQKGTQEEVAFTRVGKAFVSEDMSENLYFFPSDNDEELVATDAGEDGKQLNYFAMRVNTDENVLVIEASKFIPANASEDEIKNASSKYSESEATLVSDEKIGKTVATSYTVCSIH